LTYGASNVMLNLTQPTTIESTNSAGINQFLSSFASERARLLIVCSTRSLDWMIVFINCWSIFSNLFRC